MVEGHKERISDFFKKKGIETFSLTEHLMSGRNKIFLVKEYVTNNTYFLKINLHTSSEIWFYNNCSNYQHKAEMFAMDVELNLICLKNYSKGKTLFYLPNKKKRIYFLSRLASHLAQLHSLPLTNEAPNAQVFNPNIDPVDIELWKLASPALQKLIRLLQDPDIISNIWSELEKQRPLYGIIHGDLKLDNIIFVDKNLKIIDWELCGKGELVGDIGAVIGSMIILWLDELQIDNVENPMEWENNSIVHFDFVKKNINNFLIQYMKLSNDLIRQTLSLKLIALHTCKWLILRTWAEASQSSHLTRNQLARLLFVKNFYSNPSNLLHPKLFAKYA